MKTLFPTSLACALLVACTAPTAYQTASTSDLWVQHSAAQSPLELAYIEAELASRGQRSSGVSYLGQRTAVAYGKPRYQRDAERSGDLDCSDFASAAEAQKAFLAAGGPLSDPNNLDADGDGLACEWGRTLTENAKRYRAPVQRSASRTCYVGPRGGTYTITSSGNKNYSGC